MWTNPFRTPMAAMVWIGIMATACGGGAPSSVGNPAGAAAVTPGDVVLVELQEGGTPPSFAPSVIEVKKGAAIKFRFSGRDDQAHTFSVLQAGINLEIAAGETKETEAVTFNQAGTIFFFCRFHRGVGSTGNLKVTN